MVDTVSIPRDIAFDRDLSPRAITLYTRMTALFGESVQMRTSINDLVDKTGLGRGTVGRGLAELKEAGYLTREQNKHGGKYGEELYTLHPQPIR